MNILLVGYGIWGKQIARVLRYFAAQGRCNIKGVVVVSSHTVESVEKDGLKAFRLLPSEALPLEGVDAVVIASSSYSHYEFIAQCLPLAHVFVEKPITIHETKLDLIKQLSEKYPHHVLMVGHIWRFHPFARLFKGHCVIQNSDLKRIDGSFINPIDTKPGNADPVLEFLHLFDLLHFTFGELPDIIWPSGTDSMRMVDWQYNNLSGHWAGTNGLSGRFKFGWEGTIKIRQVTAQKKDLTKVNFDLYQEAWYDEEEPLKAELGNFLRACKSNTVVYPTVDVGIDVAKAAFRSRVPKTIKWMPRVAVIGGGIFGCTIAGVLPRNTHVQIFDSNELMSQASVKNQFRHHEGFHYPRSEATVEAIQTAKDIFDSIYGRCIDYSIPSYYAVNRGISKTSPDQFKNFFTKMGIFFVEAPCPSMINPESVCGVFKTREGVYDPVKLKNRALEFLGKHPNTVPRPRNQVIGVKLCPDGTKQVEYIDGGYILKDRFEYVINATYSNTNLFRRWLDFDPLDLKYRLKEIVVIELPETQSRVAATIVDGDFATIVPIPGEPNCYTLGDVPLSIILEGTRAEIDRFVGNSHIIGTHTRWIEMKHRCSYWFPILKEAKYKRSMYTVLPVVKEFESTDGRPTLVDDHGFGCYSVLSGKIIEAVKAASIIRENF